MKHPDVSPCFPKKVLIFVAGGTGGHVFPAISVAEAAKDQNLSVILITDHRGFFFADPYSALFTKIYLCPFSPAGLWRSIGWIKHLKSIFSRHQPHAVLGFGGSLSLAPLLLARWKNIFSAFHQSDSVMGRANRLLYPWIHRAFVNTPLPSYPRATVVGMPIRSTFFSSQISKTSDSASSPFHLLVLGGSQGASFWARCMPEVLGLLPESYRKRLRIVHHIRATDKNVYRRYRDLRIPSYTPQFMKNIHCAMKKSHLIFSRAGASSIAEISASGRPMVLVPYPHATQNHQKKNAQTVVERGGGWMMEEKHWNPATLAKILKNAMDSPLLRKEMGEINQNHFEKHSAKIILSLLNE